MGYCAVINLCTMSYYPEYTCTTSPEEALAQELAQNISGIFSVIGSAMIVTDIIRKLIRGAQTDPYQRIMLGLSLFDVLHSFFDSVLGTMMTPTESGWIKAFGNQSSCTVQGFFSALGFTGAFGYQIALSTNILMLITFGWTQKKFAQCMEVPMHICIVSIAVIYAIIPLPFQGYNAFCGQCLWFTLLDESGDVIRGSQVQSDVYWTLFFLYIWIMLIYCSVAMISVYNTVRKQETRMIRYAVSGASEEDHFRESKRIRKILLLYTLTLFLCWGIPFPLEVIIWRIGGLDAWIACPFAIKFIRELLIPLTGWFNMLVYFMPKCLKYQRKNNTCLITSYFHVILGCGWSGAFCWRCCKMYTDENDNGEEDEDSILNFSKFNSSSKSGVVQLQVETDADVILQL